MKKCDTCNTAFLGTIFSELYFSQKIGTVLLAGVFLKQIMYCRFGCFKGNIVLLDATEITNIAVSFHCGTSNTFSTRSCSATAGLNVKMLIQKVGKCPEQDLVGYGILHCFKRKNIPPVS